MAGIHLDKILVADDSQLMHRMYEVVFMTRRHHGCQVLHASDGLEALNILEDHPDTDIILMDIDMPRMDGLTFLKERKTRNIHPEIPVMLVSRQGREDDTLRALQWGARAYITKPFLASALESSITRALTNKAPKGDASID